MEGFGALTLAGPRDPRRPRVFPTCLAARAARRLSKVKSAALNWTIPPFFGFIW